MDLNIDFRKKILPPTVHTIYKNWAATWRKFVHEPISLTERIAKGLPCIMAVWHGDEIALITFSQYYKLATLTSTSKDGELMDEILNKIGMVTSRGSSTRGGVSALKGLIRLSKSGYIPVVPVDGPKGPHHVPKPGVFELSRMLNAPIFPGGIAATSQYTFKKTWNKTYIPLPFSAVQLYWGEPMGPITKDQDPRDPRLSESLKEKLETAYYSAAKIIADL